MNQNTVKKDKKFPIVVAICVGICMIMVATVIFAGAFVAGNRMSKVERILSGEGEIVAVLSDPSQRGETIFSSAETVLRDEQADSLRNKLLEIVRETKFDRTEPIPTGNWNVGVRIYVGEEKTTVYLTDGQIALEHDGKLTYYDVSDGASSAYTALYKEIKTLLGGSN